MTEKIINPINIWFFKNMHKIKILISLIAIVIFCGLHTSNVFAQTPQNLVEGKIIEITSKDTLKVELTTGEKIIANTTTTFDIGNKIVITKIIDETGNAQYFASDHIRRDKLLILFLIFTGVVVIIGGGWGLMSIIGMGISFLVIFKIILPKLLAGEDPITTAIMGSLIIIPVTFYLSHGINKKTNLSIVGTIISLIATGILAKIFVEFSNITGTASEEVMFLKMYMGNNLNTTGLVIAGIIIGGIGVLDDVTISQASIVQELKKANPELGFIDTYLRAMNVGRDHISSMVNTLVLVYAGASMPLLLMFVNNPMPYEQVINFEIIAEEIVKTLVGSIGLVMAVPITTLLACIFITEE